MRPSTGQRILAVPERGQEFAPLLIRGVHVRSLLVITTGFLVLLGCGSSGGGGSGGGGGSDGGGGGDPGSLIDNLKWVPTDAGEEFFGTPPDGATCPLIPEGDCPEPDGQCITIPQGSDCVVSFIPECFDPFTVLSVYTEVCNWITLEQPSLRAIRAGDEIEIRAFHFALNAPFGGEARISLTVGDEMIFDETVLIPQQSASISRTWTATQDFEVGTPMLFHVNNHGNNEYLLIEVNICQDRPPGGGDAKVPCLP